MTRRAALVAGATGCTANALLATFYAGRATSIDQPGAAEWAGTANDLVGALSSAAMVPMALGLLAHLGRPRRLIVATWAAVGAMAVLVASSVLLLLEVIPFTAQAAASIPAALIFGWLLLVGRAAPATGHLPAPLSKAAVTIGPSLLAALAAAGAAALLPRRIRRPTTPRRHRTHARDRRVRGIPDLASPTGPLTARHPRHHRADHPPRTTTGIARGLPCSPNPMSN